MADFEKLIPFIIHFAAGVYGPEGRDLRLPPERQFEIARKGGWSLDPDDPGGATMTDVTLAAYSAYRRRKGLPRPSEQELRRISYAEWREILKTMYWDRCRADGIRSQGVANMIADWVWGSGPASLKKVQRILGTQPDGIVGPKTLAAINGADSGDLFRKCREERRRHYCACRGAWKYLKGWLRRLDALQPDGSFLIYGRRF